MNTKLHWPNNWCKCRLNVECQYVFIYTWDYGYLFFFFSILVYLLKCFFLFMGISFRSCKKMKLWNKAHPGLVLSVQIFITLFFTSRPPSNFSSQNVSIFFSKLQEYYKKQQEQLHLQLLSQQSGKHQVKEVSVFQKYYFSKLLFDIYRNYIKGL